MLPFDLTVFVKENPAKKNSKVYKDLSITNSKLFSFFYYIFC